MPFGGVVYALDTDPGSGTNYAGYFYGGPFNVSGDGLWDVLLLAVDRASNVSAFDTVKVKIDTTPPETTIDSGPSGTTSNSSPTFSFSANEAGSSFECKLDGASFSPCSSPKTLASLPDGNHTFAVRATDPAANTDPTPAERSFKVDTNVDTTPPETTIDSGPSGPTNNPTPAFSFSANEAGSTFECKVDGGSFAACSSPKTLASLPDGNHTFAVRATDPAANTDPTPAERSFKVDTVAPETTIDSGPSGPTNNPTPTFSFSANEAGSTFECKVDGGSFAACSSPKTLASLPDGNHTFAVRATDPAANTDPTPAERSFKVDTVAPTASISCPPAPAPSKTSPVRCTASWNDPGGQNASGVPFGGVVYALDTDPGSGTNYAGYFYGGPFNVSGDGLWDVLLLAVDRASNVSAFATVKVTIDPTIP